MPPIAPTPCAARGKLATPHKQEQAQVPPASPEPDAVVETAPVAAAVPEATAVAAALAVPATLLAPPAMLAVEPVPFWAIANCTKSAWDFSAVGLMEKAMPLPQWAFCLQ